MDLSRERSFLVKKKNAGITTILVVCAMAIIMTLSLGLFLTASVLIKTAEKSSAVQQSAILAVSFSEQVEKQLTDEKYIYKDNDSEATAKVQDIYHISLWHYVKESITSGSWPYYEEGTSALHSYHNAVRTFYMDAAGIAGEISQIKMDMYWTRSEKEQIPAELVILTTVTVKEQSYTITDSYKLQVTGDSYETWKWKHMDKR